MSRHGIARRAVVGLLLAGGIHANPATAGKHRIIVTSNGWHSGIVVPRTLVPLAAIPEAADFPTAAHIEFGWGDAEYYPTPRATLGLALLAAFPGPAVMHVSGLPDHPARVFPTVSLLTLALDDAQLQRLIAALAASFDRAGAARAMPTTAAGLYPFSRFYPATGRFHAFNTCNTWTAQTLAAAGLPISAGGVQSADDLTSRLRPLAVDQ